MQHTLDINQTENYINWQLSRINRSQQALIKSIQMLSTCTVGLLHSDTSSWSNNTFPRVPDTIAHQDYTNISHGFGEKMMSMYHFLSIMIIVTESTVLRNLKYRSVLKM